MPHAAIVPGERFRETYYWDSYWTVLGLIACGMLDTAEGVARNLLSLVERFGFVPNARARVLPEPHAAARLGVHVPSGFRGVARRVT